MTGRERDETVERRARFLDIFLRGAGPSSELLGAFALGLLVIGILSNLLYDLFITPQDVLTTVWQPLVAIAVFTCLAYLLYRRDLQRKRTVQAVVDERRIVPPYAGLIWMLGPGAFDHLLFALQHHQKGGGATHCWLVMQADAEPVQQAFSQLSQQLVEQGMTTRLHPFYISKLDVWEAYKAVRTIFEREAVEEGLEPGQVIADITGGTKPLTTGMVLAAITTNGALEYVESERDDQGRPIPSTLYVVRVDTSFYLAEER